MSLIKKFNGKKNVVAEQIKKYREEQNMYCTTEFA